MPFRVSGKKIDVGEALRTRISQRVADATAKYFDGGFSGHVTVGREGFGFRTECVIHLDSGIVLEADALAVDAYSSADKAAERIEKRLRRYKRRLRDRQATRSDGNALDRTSVDAPAVGAVVERAAVGLEPLREPEDGHQLVVIGLGGGQVRHADPDVVDESGACHLVILRRLRRCSRVRSS